jgi:hypothetical protein
VARPYPGILSVKKEETVDTGNNLDTPHGHYADEKASLKRIQTA